MVVLGVMRNPAVTENHATTRQYDTLVSPATSRLRIEIVVGEVLHEADALPTGDTALRRQRVQPAERREGVVAVVAPAIEMYALGRLGCERTRVSKTSLGWVVLEGVQ